MKSAIADPDSVFFSKQKTLSRKSNSDQKENLLSFDAHEKGIDVCINNMKTTCSERESMGIQEMHEKMVMLKEWSLGNG